MINNNIGETLFNWASKLFPINRSLTGRGVRETLAFIKSEIPELLVQEVPSGSKVFDWEVPSEWQYSFSATEYAYPIFRSFLLDPEGGVKMVFAEHYGTRSQDLPQVFHDAGQFYWGRPEAWLEEKPMFGKQSIPLIIPRWRVQDIDTLDDWKRAEMLASQILQK